MPPSISHKAITASRYSKTKCVCVCVCVCVHACVCVCVSVCGCSLTSTLQGSLCKKRYLIFFTPFFFYKSRPPFQVAQ